MKGFGKNGYCETGVPDNAFAGRVGSGTAGGARPKKLART